MAPTASRSTERVKATLAVRSYVSRLMGPTAPALNAAARLDVIERHFIELKREVRLGARPGSPHLAAIAAHCVLLLMEDERDHG